MYARLGHDDEQLFLSPNEDLLREVTGILPERPIGNHVRLDNVLGVRSAQRLGLCDVAGTIIVGIWPAELQPQARYLYSERRAQRVISAARAAGWEVQANLHLAFRFARPSQRLYLNPRTDVEEYVRRWERIDAGWIGAHSPEDVRRVLWPWLEQRGYASPADLPSLGQFLDLLGRRDAHLRPAVRLNRRWGYEEVQRLRRSGSLVKEIRAAVNEVLRAADEPLLPFGR